MELTNHFIETNVQEELPIILTRYLYIKHDVLASLLIAIIEKDYDEAVFWGCELYYSGLEEYTSEFVFTIYNEWFKSVNHPKLYDYMEKLQGRHTEGAHIIATMIKNLTMPWMKATSVYFVKQEETPMPPPNFKRCVVVSVEPNQVESYKTFEMTKKIPARNVLKHVCKYATKKQYMEVFECVHRSIPSLGQKHRDNWLYYAALYTPIWRKRVEQYNGQLNTITKTVYFENDEQLEEFGERFEYELDEQSLDVQERLTHINTPVQCTLENFLEKLPKYITQ
jgi:hypothetical protein